MDPSRPLIPDGPAGARGSPPLVVDVDGTLVTTDLLWEGLNRILFSRPWRLASLVPALLHGRVAFKREVAGAAGLDLARIPLRGEVESLLEAARAEDRAVILASAADPGQVEELARRLGADDVLVGDGDRNLKGAAKLEAIRQRYETFDYVGDAAADEPLFRAARRSYRVGPGRWARRSRGEDDPERLDPGSRLTSWVRALRPHQWAKNGLLVLPILAAHLAWTGDLVVDVLLGLAAFSMTSSAVYLVNDLADLPHDRLHPTKRDRPLAAGRISIPAAWGTVLVLIAGATALALLLPPLFGLILLGYVLSNAAYSGGLKRIAIVDLMILAGLYTLRVIAGGALADVPLTGWFLAFCIFLFLSLATVKRVVELGNHLAPGAGGGPAGRGYRFSDLPILLSVGPAAGVMSSLVYCLYITSPVRGLYRQPEILWLGLPLFLYWILRVWLLAVRGEVHEDPVVFLLRDPISYLVLAAFLGVVFLAS